MPDIDSPGSDSKLKIDLVKAALLKRSDLPYYVTGCKVPVLGSDVGARVSCRSVVPECRAGVSCRSAGVPCRSVGVP